MGDHIDFLEMNAFGFVLLGGEPGLICLLGSKDMVLAYQHQHMGIDYEMGPCSTSNVDHCFVVMVVANGHWIAFHH